MMLRQASLAAVLGTLALLGAACAVNPVTGERELALITRSEEIRIGERNYVPAQQIQGGPYNVDPGLVRYVAGVGQRLAAVSDRPDLPYEFRVVNDGTPNAWALPGGKIAVHRGLLTELDSEAELAAVLGHEIVHAAARHSAQAMERGLLLQAGISAVAITAADRDYANLLVGGTALAATLISQRYSREAELEADRYGMRYMARAGYDPAAAVDLQRTFVRLAEGRERGWLKGLFASHPPSPERVEANRETGRELNVQGGRMAREAYRRQTAVLRQDETGYRAYEAGREALAQGNLQAAWEHAGRALEIEPGEALFHGLRGDVRFRQQRWADAVTCYRAAIQRNDRYFRFHLQSGLAARRLDRLPEGRRDLERSLELLPTASAHDALGNIALEQDRRDAAVQHYRIAARSDSPAGRHAREMLKRLGVADGQGS